MTSLVPQEKLREAALFGAEVIRVSGNYDQTKQIATQFAQRRHLWAGPRFRFHPRARVNENHRLRDRGNNLAGGRRIGTFNLSAEAWDRWVYIRDLQNFTRMGLIERIPKLAVIQTEGCSPMVKAFKAGKRCC